MQTVAILVLAQRNPLALERFCRIFQGHPYKFIAHLDRKIDLQCYSEGIDWPDNVIFVDERVEVFWGGFNMIRATESLARIALADKANEVFVLVSDDTLPLFPPDRTYQELFSCKDRIDIGLSRRNPPFFRRYNDFYFLDSAATSARVLDTQLRSVDATTIDAIIRLQRLRQRGKYPLPEVWSGSQWWSLGRSTLTDIIAELAGNSWLRESFEFSAVPDELAFQTLYANQKGLTSRSFTGPMLSDMSRFPAPFVYQAHDEIGSIPAGKLFVRKIANESALSMACELQAEWTK